MRLCFRVLVILAMLIWVSGSAYAADIATDEINVMYGDFKVFVNGREFMPKDGANNEIKPFAYNGNMYVPVEEFARALSMGVNWDQDSLTLHLGHQRASLNRAAPHNYVGNAGAYAWGGSSVNVVDAVHLGGIKHSDALRFRSDCETAMSPFTLHNLNGQYRTLSGIIGRVDDSGVAGVTLHFRGDGKELMSHRMKTNDVPKYFTISVEGVEQLMIQVEFPNVDRVPTDYAVIAFLE